MRSVVIARFLLIMCAMSVFVSQGTYAVLAAERIDFNRDIRPILSEACFQCHGPDQNQRKANLRLDTAAGLRGEGEAAKVIVPGKPDDSELILRVLATDPAEQMPPADSGKTLTEAQKELLRRWIAEGAEYRGHWAYIAPVKPAVPMVPGNTFVRNHIDQFLLATMLSKGVQPSPATDPVTLVRRLSFDLTGLPRLCAIRARLPTKHWSMNCWPLQNMASAWRWPGSIRFATPTPTAITGTITKTAISTATG